MENQIIEMENQTIEEKATGSSTTVPHIKSLRLPALALGLSLLPLIIALLHLLILRMPNVAALFAILLPVAGLTLGVLSLCRGKTRIGKSGALLSIFAIALPSLAVISVALFFVGAMTGLIALM